MVNHSSSPDWPFCNKICRLFTYVITSNLFDQLIALPVEGTYNPLCWNNLSKTKTKTGLLNWTPESAAALAAISMIPISYM